MLALVFCLGLNYAIWCIQGMLIAVVWTASGIVNTQCQLYKHWCMYHHAQCKLYKYCCWFRDKDNVRLYLSMGPNYHGNIITLAFQNIRESSLETVRVCASGGNFLIYGDHKIVHLPKHEINHLQVFLNFD